MLFPYFGTRILIEKFRIDHDGSEEFCAEFLFEKPQKFRRSLLE